jgi:hypothetical protein
MLCANTDVVPIKYRVSSGLKGYSFRVSKALPPFSDIAVNTYSLRLNYQQKWQRILITKDKFPNEVEALSILAKVDGETFRESRYINIHSAYEAVIPLRSVHLSAIRHSFAHAATSLNRKEVKTTLLSNFGDLKINLQLHEHRKIYYRALVELLIAIDKALFLRLTARWSEIEIEDSQ